MQLRPRPNDQKLRICFAYNDEEPDEEDTKFNIVHGPDAAMQPTNNEVHPSQSETSANEDATASDRTMRVRLHLLNLSNSKLTTFFQTRARTKTRRVSEERRSPTVGPSAKSLGKRRRVDDQ